MGTRKMILRFVLFPILMFIALSSNAANANDWAYELPDRAKNIYAEKKLVNCGDIESLLKVENHKDLYFLIRDAALFKDNSCESSIKRNLTRLKKIEGVSDAISFYQYQLGDNTKLKELADSYDRSAQEIQDHWTVELFGFIGEWELTGRRLVRHAKSADGAGSELLCSALKWKRFLYGEVDFQKNWIKYGDIENLSIKKRLDKLRYCLP